MTGNTDPFVKYRTPLGLRKDGRPIFPIAGGSSVITAPSDPEIEPVEQPEPIQFDPSKFFTREQLDAEVERVRSEEKDKLYGRLTKTAEEVQALRVRAEEADRLQAAKEEEEAAAKRREEESELSAKELLERRDSEYNERFNNAAKTWEDKWSQVQEEKDQAVALLEREREFSELRDYIQGVVAKVTGENTVAPQLIGYIGGNSKDEVDASVTRAIETSNQIVASVTAVQQQIPPAATANYGTRVTATPVGMDPTQQSQQLTAEQIRDMPMDQFAKIRGKLGIKNSGQGQGLYG